MSASRARSLVALVAAAAAVAALAPACGQRVAIGGSDTDEGDPDVPPHPAPCLQQACGSPCTLPSTCDPADPSCTAQPGFCTVEGLCAPAPSPCPTGCEGQVCGALCNPCPPDAADCGTVVCDPDGNCTSSMEAHCDMNGWCVPGPALPPCPPQPVDSCLQLPCGAPCPPPCGGDPNCPPGEFVCDTAGACLPLEAVLCAPTPPSCANMPCGAPCDPSGELACDSFGQCVPASGLMCAQACAGLLCGAPCDPCIDNPNCEPPSPFSYLCDEGGMCVPAAMGTCPGGYEPCAGKACGEACSICQPGFPCEEPPPSTCDINGLCSVGVATCN